MITAAGHAAGRRAVPLRSASAESPASSLISPTSAALADESQLTNARDRVVLRGPRHPRGPLTSGGSAGPLLATLRRSAAGRLPLHALSSRGHDALRVSTRYACVGGGDLRFGDPFTRLRRHGISVADSTSARRLRMTIISLMVWQHHLTLIEIYTGQAHLCIHRADSQLRRAAAGTPLNTHPSLRATVARGSAFTPPRCGGGRACAAPPSGRLLRVVS